MHPFPKLLALKALMAFMNTMTASCGDATTVANLLEEQTRKTKNRDLARRRKQQLPPTRTDPIESSDAFANVSWTLKIILLSEDYDDAIKLLAIGLLGRKLLEWAPMWSVIGIHASADLTRMWPAALWMCLQVFLPPGSVVDSVLLTRYDETAIAQCDQKEQERRTLANQLHDYRYLYFYCSMKADVNDEKALRACDANANCPYYVILAGVLMAANLIDGVNQHYKKPTSEVTPWVPLWYGRNALTLVLKTHKLDKPIECKSFCTTRKPACVPQAARTFLVLALKVQLKINEEAINHCPLLDAKKLPESMSVDKLRWLTTLPDFERLQWVKTTSPNNNVALCSRKTPVTARTKTPSQKLTAKRQRTEDAETPLPEPTVERQEVAEMPPNRTQSEEDAEIAANSLLSLHKLPER